jgi:hypothetical protein
MKRCGTRLGRPKPQPDGQQGRVRPPFDVYQPLGARSNETGVPTKTLVERIISAALQEGEPT